MRKYGLRARTRRKKTKTTVVGRQALYAPNLLDRKFSAVKPNQRWVGDITYIDTNEGMLYLAVMIDLFSRRVVEWKADKHMRVELAQDALQMVLKNRSISSGLVHHTDRGPQYISHNHQQLLRAKCIVCSMSRKGECWDNAVAESFFGRLKEELTRGKCFETHREATEAIDDYICTFYNAQRRQKGLGNVSPVEYEILCAASSAA